MIVRISEHMSSALIGGVASVCAGAGDLCGSRLLKVSSNPCRFAVPSFSSPNSVTQAMAVELGVVVVRDLVAPVYPAKCRPVAYIDGKRLGTRRPIRSLRLEGAHVGDALSA